MTITSFVLFAGVGLSFGLVLGAVLRRTDRLRAAVATDPLTGLLSRRSFGEELGRELSRASRYGTPFGLLLADVDDFKRVNDTRGHHAGDAVLRGMARCMRSVTRTSDSLGRWGGDELVILAPGTDPAGCRALAERLREAVRAQRFGGGLRVSLSIGVAQFTPGDDAADILRRADEAMYRAKRAGPGRMEADSPGVETCTQLRVL